MPIIARTEEETSAVAARLAARARPGDILLLEGPLGAGKTSFARAYLRALTGAPGLIVPSPTFTLLQTYEAGGLVISHFDLYRLKTVDELDEIGWDDALADGITLVEWPERAGTRLPENYLALHFEILPDSTRQCVIESHGNWDTRL